MVVRKVSIGKILKEKGNRSSPSGTPVTENNRRNKVIIQKRVQETVTLQICKIVPCIFLTFKAQHGTFSWL